MTKTNFQPVAQPQAPDEFLSTSEAARLLGVSVGTVQQMVESGTLNAWKTAGGHRRIYAKSVRSMLNIAETGSPTPSDGSSLALIIVDDDQIQRIIYEERIKALGLAIQLRLVADGFTALLEAGKEIPDVMVVDLIMDGMDGFELIKRLRSTPSFDSTDIIVATSLDKTDLSNYPPLPSDVTVLHKPVAFDELSGFLRARLSAKLRLLPKANVSG